MRFGDGVKVKSFCDNFVVILIEDDAIRKKLLDFGRGFILSCAWHLRPCENSNVAELWGFSFSGGWLQIVDIPPHFRMLEIVKSLAGFCGDRRW